MSVGIGMQNGEEVIVRIATFVVQKKAIDSVMEIEVGGDERPVGDQRIPRFTNSCECDQEFHGQTR